MAKASVKIVGSEENPIKVYWDVKNRKTDEYLLLLSICSGAYGNEFCDIDSFIDLSNKFFRYAKKDEKYNKQFSYVLSYGQADCVDYLESTLINKWNVTIEYYREEKIALA